MSKVHCTYKYWTSYLCEEHILGYANACGALGRVENFTPDRLGNALYIFHFGIISTDRKVELHVRFVARNLIDLPIELCCAPEQDLCHFLLHLFVPIEIIRQYNELKTSRLAQLLRTAKKHPLLDPQLSSL